MSAEVRYRAMQAGEASAVSALILASFDEFIGPDYEGDEGLDEFRRFAAPEAIEARAATDHQATFDCISSRQLLLVSRFYLAFVLSVGTLGSSFDRAGARLCQVGPLPRGAGMFDGAHFGWAV